MSYKSVQIHQLSRKSRSRLERVWIDPTRAKAKDEEIALLRSAGWKVEGLAEQFLHEFWGTLIPLAKPRRGLLQGDYPPKHVAISCHPECIPSMLEYSQATGYQAIVGRCTYIGSTWDDENWFAMGSEGEVYCFIEHSLTPAIKYISPFIRRKFPICKQGSTLPVYRLGHDLTSSFDNLCRGRFRIELIGMVPGATDRPE